MHRESDCTGAEGHEVEEICRKKLAALPPESPESLRARGRAWGNARTGEPDCTRNFRNYDHYDSDPNFIAGCMDALTASRRQRGDFWAQEHRIVAEDDCKPTDQALTTPEEVEACKAAAPRNRVNEGWYWALKNAVVTVDDCERSMPARPERADFVSGCQKFVQEPGHEKLDAERGKQWAGANPLQSEAECHGRIKNAPPEFEQGCEESLRRIREKGKDWARIHKVSAAEDCKYQSGYERHPVFVLACLEMIRLLRECAHNPSKPQCCAATAPPSCP